MTVLDATADWRVIKVMIRARELLRNAATGLDPAEVINEIDHMIYQDLTIPQIIMAYRQAAPHQSDYNHRVTQRDAWATSAGEMIAVNAKLMAAEPEEE